MGSPPIRRKGRHCLTLLILVASLLGGAVVRTIGIRHGEPIWIFHPDVSKQVHVAMNVYRSRPDPIHYDEDDVKRRLYPYGTAVVLGTALRRGEKAGLFRLDRGESPENERWLWSLRFRYLATASSLASTAVLLLYLSRFLAPLPFLFTGLLLAFEPLNARYSHYGMNDVPLISLLLMVWLAASRMGMESRRGLLWSPLAGVLLGAGFGVKYQALLGLLFPALAWFGLGARKGPGRLLLSAALFGAAFATGAIVTSPVLRGDPFGFPSQFLEFMGWQADILGDSVPFAEKAARNISWLAAFSLESGLLFLTPPLAWGLRSLLHRRQQGRTDPLVLSGLLFSLALPVVLVLSRDIMRESDVMYVFPFLIVLAGIMLSDLTRAKGGLTGVAGLLPLLPAAALLLFFVSVSLRDSLAFSRPDTRLRARQWCAAHIPPGSRVLRDSYVLPVGREGLREERYRFLVDPPAAELIQAGEFDYVIATSLAHDRFFDPLSAFFSLPRQMAFGSLLSTLPVLALFEDRPLPFNHPTVTVYGKGGGAAPRGKAPSQGGAQR